MELEKFETADCTIKELVKNENEVRILFSFVYDIEREKYSENATLIISDWSDFITKLYISEKPHSSTQEIILNDENFEAFEIIQNIIIKDDKLILQGYSQPSGHWMEYIFTNCKYRMFLLSNSDTA